MNTLDISKSLPGAIKSDGYNARELFSAFDFEVPIYQRVFTWGEEQFERLFRDLTHHFSNGAGSGRYYLGVVTVVRPKEGSRLVLVDGQQRLTCLLLLGALLGWGLDPRKLAYAARPADRKALETVYSICGNGKTPSESDIETIGNAAMAAFVRYATGKGRARLSRLREERDTILENLTLMVSLLPDEPYQNDIFEQNRYFEKMNSGGKQLEPHEILKVKMCEGLNSSCLKDWNAAIDFSKRFSKEAIGAETDSGKGRCSLAAVIEGAAISGGDSDANARVKSVREQCEKGWRQYQHGDEPRDALRRGPISLGVFLLHVRALFLKIDAGQSNVSLGDETDLLVLFREMTHLPPEKRAAFFTRMAEYRRFLDSQIIHIVAADGNSPRYAFYEEDPSGGVRDAAAAERRALMQFQSMLHVSSDAAQRWILDAYESLAETGRTDDATLFACLKQQDAARHPIPDEEPFKALRYPQIDRYWFWKLDYLLWERHENDRNDALFRCLRDENDHRAIADYAFRRDRSIEHLHPQNPPSWGESDDWKIDQEANGDAVRNGFGNLAVIAAGFNSAQSNDSISTKIGRVDDQVREKRLQSIKLLLMVRSVQSNPQGWTVQAAETHESTMRGVLTPS